MKIKLFTFLALFFVLNVTNVKAVLVTINDAGFVSWLQANYSACMTGNQMETSCTDIISAGYISIPNTYTISDLDGLQYFTSMSTFICQNNSLTSIPTLPQTSLTSYKVGNNSLTTIPNIPSSVTALTINNNNFTSLPTLPAGLLEYNGGSNPGLTLPVFPASIEIIGISNNSLTSFPVFSNTVIDLDISNNPLASLPVFPTNLENLGIDNMNLTQLPVLPSSLLILGAAYNDFTVLNSFPTNLTFLNIDFNATLDSVSNLPNSIVTLSINYCALTYVGNIPSSAQTVLLYNNNLTSIPTLPNSISTLNVSNNSIITFDYLPSSMDLFNVFNNNISCLPIIPDVPGNISLNLTNNPITCLPNYTNDMNLTISSLPLCVTNDIVNNPMGCSSAEGISGYIYSDNDLTCDRTNNELGISNVPVKIYDDMMNQIGIVSSIANGRYFYPTTVGAYTVIVDTIGIPVEASCLNPGVDSTFTLTAVDSLADNVNFGLVCASDFDLGATSAVVEGWVFPGQNHTVKMNIGDISDFYNLNCAQGIAGTVTISVTGPVDYVSNLTGTLTPTVAGLTFTYSIIDFGLVNFTSDFGLEFMTQTTAQAGDQVCVNVDITPTFGDYNLSNNTFDYCYDVVNSFDPNDKTVYPKEVTSNDEYLYYTINFQNIGSAPAFNIRLQDTLSNQLDLTTFNVLDYSHDMHFNLTGNNLTVYYPNIMLIDSTTSPEDSKGFIQFKVKPNNQFVAGDSIENEAYIYFDFNTPILTNTTKTIFLESSASLNEFSSNLTIDMYPNPSNGSINLNANSNIKSITAYDQLGRTVNVKVDINDTNAKVDFGSQTKGFIILSIETTVGTSVKKVFNL